MLRSEVYPTVLLNNKRYVELNSQIIQVQYELLNNLPKKLQPLVNRYDQAEAEHDGIVMSLMYRQGFLDGARAVRMMKNKVWREKGKG